ncbi:MAG: hypothetical protein H7301_01100 [Cryobacterium sp.]|nr:hypothetical protein [Oligoflexia bacterium]
MRLSTVSLALFPVAASLAFSGCDLGKFGTKTTTELSGYDTISGYYTSLPQSVAFSATMKHEDPRNQNGTVNQIPDFLKSVMANPTLLYYDDPIKGLGSLRSHVDTANGIPTKIQDKTGTFGSSSSAYGEVTGCRLVQEKTNSGTFSQLADTVIVNKYKARGRLALDFELKYSLEGTDADCDPVRALFKSCYIDGTNCSSDSQSIFYRAFIQEIFDPFIHSGIMTEEEIGVFRDVRYEAKYE